MIFLFDIYQLSSINDCFCICRSINGPPRGYGKKGNLPFLSMGIWEHEQICQGNMETMQIMGSSLEILFKGTVKENTFLG